MPFENFDLLFALKSCCPWFVFHFLCEGRARYPQHKTHRANPNAPVTWPIHLKAPEYCALIHRNADKNCPYQYETERACRNCPSRYRPALQLSKKYTYSPMSNTYFGVNSRDYSPLHWKDLWHWWWDRDQSQRIFRNRFELPQERTKSAVPNSQNRLMGCQFAT